VKHREETDRETEIERQRETERQRDRETEGQRDRERKKERKREHVCQCCVRFHANSRVPEAEDVPRRLLGPHLVASPAGSYRPVSHAFMR
jgi:hypothetical protein